MALRRGYSYSERKWFWRCSYRGRSFIGWSSM